MVLYSSFTSFLRIRSLTGEFIWWINDEVRRLSGASDRRSTESDNRVRSRQCWTKHFFDRQMNVHKKGNSFDFIQFPGCDNFRTMIDWRTVVRKCITVTINPKKVQNFDKQFYDRYPLPDDALWINYGDGSVLSEYRKTLPEPCATCELGVYNSNRTQ